MRKDSYHRPDSAAMYAVLEKYKDTITELILRLAWNMGLLTNEIQQLTWEQVSLEKQTIHLPNRVVPMDDDVRRCLQTRRDKSYSKNSEFVVLSDLRHVHMHRVHIMRFAREALDEAGMSNITLMDLRHDYVIRLLEKKDWSYVSRVSGSSLITLKTNYSQYLSEHRTENIEPEQTTEKENIKVEEKLKNLIVSEGTSPVGLAVWFSWKLGMQSKDMITLVWEQVDFKKQKIHLPLQTIDIDEELAVKLKTVHAARKAGEAPHVLLTPRARKPFTDSQLSRAATVSLVRHGIDGVTLGDLTSWHRQQGEDAPILQYAREKGSVTRNEVMEQLGITKSSAYGRLHRLVEQRKMVKIGSKYFLAGEVIPPEKQYETIRQYLEQYGVGYRKDLADLLRIDPKVCGWILHGMVEEGKLILKNQQYTLPATGENQKKE